MESPIREGSSSDVDIISDSSSDAAYVHQTATRHPTPSSSSSSRAATPETSPVPVFQARSGPAGPSQRPVKYKSRNPPTHSFLEGDIKISFTQLEERTRALPKNSLLCRYFYRTFYEGSATLSAFVTKDCLVKHRDVPHLKLEDGNAFQNVGDFNPLQDMTPERMRRQHKTNQKVDPSPFVSAFSTKEDAEAKANTQYNQSRLVGHRVAVAEIDTCGLIPATIRAQMKTFKTEYIGNSLVAVDNTSTIRPVKIPVWIRDTARPADGSAITFQDLHDSGADMWVLGSEMAMTGPFNMKYGAADTHDSEWMCCGPIPLSCIASVMPFDGQQLHLEKGHAVVTSTQSIERYAFNWDERKWLHNPKTRDFRPYRLGIPGHEHRRPHDDDDAGGAAESHENHGDLYGDLRSRRKRARIELSETTSALALSPIITTIDEPPRPAGHVPAARNIRA